MKDKFANDVGLKTLDARGGIISIAWQSSHGRGKGNRKLGGQHCLFGVGAGNFFFPAAPSGTHFFADHHPFRSSEIAALKVQAGQARLVTTEKDYVRLDPQDRAGITVLPVRATFEDPAALDRLLDRIA